MRCFRIWLSAIVAGLLFATSSVGAQAASLRVAPTYLSLTAPGSAETLTLQNETDQPMNVQIRVFRWTQSGGVDRFAETDAVVASPPAATLQPGGEYVVRVVRTAGQPVTQQESYRVIVDELPDPNRRRAGTVNLVLRHSIPVFFRPADAGPPELGWSVQPVSGGVALLAQNTGGTSVRLADVTLSQGGQVVAGQDGLAGYVLPGATMQWLLGTRSAIGASSLELRAQTELGPVDATVPVEGR